MRLNLSYVREVFIQVKRQARSEYYEVFAYRFALSNYGMSVDVWRLLEEALYWH